MIISFWSRLHIVMCITIKLSQGSLYRSSLHEDKNVRVNWECKQRRNTFNLRDSDNPQGPIANLTRGITSSYENEV